MSEIQKCCKLILVYFESVFLQKYINRKNLYLIIFGREISLTIKTRENLWVIMASYRTEPVVLRFERLSKYIFENSEKNNNDETHPHVS